MKKKSDNNLKSQSEAAELAGVTRQAINGLKDRYSFFVGSKVDISSPDWKAYMYERGAKSEQPIVDSQNVSSNEPVQVKNKNKKDKRIDESKESGNNILSDEKKEERAKHALTGGFDPAMFVPTNPSQLKSLTEIVAKNLEMRIKLGDFITREMLNLYLDTISQNIQLLVDLSKTVSGEICNKLDRRGMEKDVEKIIDPVTTMIRDQIVTACNNAKK